MSSLAQIYSQSTGLKLGNPHVCKKFFPLSEEKYLTIQPFSKNQPAKCYDFWNEVLILLEPLLVQNKLKIYQLGEKDEPILYGTTPLNGQTSICQANYVIQNSLLHLSADSFTSHVAGILKVPQITLFGNTSSSIHGPSWRGNAILIDSHRNGRKPSFSHEHDKTINKITPEEIVNSALKLLGTNAQLNRKSLFFGKVYASTSIEWIPNHSLDANFLKEIPYVARLDYFHNEPFLFNALQQRPLSVVLKHNISNLQELMSCKKNINGITFAIEKDSTLTIEFIQQIKNFGIKINSVTFDTDSEWVSTKRLELFDICSIHKVSHPTKDNLLLGVENYTNKSDDQKEIGQDGIWFRTNKFILSDNKIFLSYFHYVNNLYTDSLKNNTTNFIDNPLIYRDIDSMYIFKQNV